MKTSIGNTTLEVAVGDITELDVDAIVAPATKDLLPMGGVADALKRVGGEAIEKEAGLQGPVEIGEAVVTTGHGLKVRWVIHAAVAGQDLKIDADAVSKATRGALACAERAHVKKLALPALGSAVGGFPLYQCTSLMTAEVARYLKDTPKTRLRRIIFATYTEEARAAFNNALSGLTRFA